MHFAARLLPSDVMVRGLLEIAALYDAHHDVDGCAVLIDFDLHAVDRLLFGRGRGLVSLPDAGQVDRRLCGEGEGCDKREYGGFGHAASVSAAGARCNQFGMAAVRRRDGRAELRDGGAIAARASAGCWLRGL